MASGSYTTSPVEAVIKTDILLFQYCGDITALAQEFVFAPPFPTAVTLESFGAAPLDSGVELAWKTASELRNLGFHLHRSTSAAALDRITSSLIPGLGSSPIGRYSFRDGGLTNGQTYFYELGTSTRPGRRRDTGQPPPHPRREPTAVELRATRATRAGQVVQGARKTVVVAARVERPTATRVRHPCGSSSVVHRSPSSSCAPRASWR